MDKNRIVIAIALAAALGCEERPRKRTSEEDVKEGISNAAQTVARYAAERKEDVTSEAEKRLAEISARIEELKRTAEHGGKTAQQETQAKIADLEKKKAEIEHQLEQARQGGSKAWRSLKGGIDQAISDLSKAVGRSK